MNDAFYKLHSNCKITKGASRSIIVDLQKNRFHFIPNDIVNLIDNNLFDIRKIKDKLEDEDHAVLEEYMEYLSDLELIFECDEDLLDNFIDLPLEWDFPAIISNAIFDGGKTLEYFNSDLIDQLESLGCNYLQLRFYDVPDRSELYRIVALINNSQVKSIDLIVGHDASEEETFDWWTKFIKQNRKIRCLTIHSAENNQILLQSLDNTGMIITVKESLHDAKHCGNIHSSYFVMNIESYTESLKYNSCLNRKVSIDKDGFIKNCPSMYRKFGHISDVSLLDAINDKDFKNIWGITKDSITKCNTCEFRNICTDCRAYIEDPDDKNSAPLKCGYNPSTCEWQDWSTNPLKKQAIKTYGF